jgi:hypothetical protein
MLPEVNGLLTPVVVEARKETESEKQKFGDSRYCTVFLVVNAVRHTSHGRRGID